MRTSIALLPLLALAAAPAKGRLDPTLHIPLTFDAFRGAPTRVPVEVRLLAPGTTDALSVETVYPDGSGVIDVVAAPGTYDVSIKAPRWLRRVLPSVAVSVPRTLPSVPLTVGDVNGDNVVSALDRARVTLALGRAAGDAGFDPLCDLDGNGVVNALDRAIVTARLGRVGDAVPAPAPGLGTAGWPIAGGDYGATFAGRGPAASGALGAPIVVGGYRSPPVVVAGADGTLYVGSDSKVLAQGAANWEVANAAGDYCRGLALTEGGVLIASTDKGVFARDAATGALRWTFATGQRTTFVVGRDGTVYARADKLYALEGSTGAVRWTILKANVQAVGDDGTLYGIATESTGTHNDVNTEYYARAWSPATGALRWSVPLGYTYHSHGFGAIGLAVAGNLIYLKTYQIVPLNSQQNISNGHVLALRTSNGSRAWIYDFASATPGYSGMGGGVSIHAGRAFTDWKGWVVALDAATGAKHWDVDGDEGSGTAIAADGTVYCLTRGIYSSLCLRALEPTTGATRWKTEPITGAGDVSPLTLADDGTVYFAASFIGGVGDARVYPVR